MKKAKKLIASVLACCLAATVGGLLAGCSSSEEYVPKLGSPKASSPALLQDGTLCVGVNTNNSPLAGKSGDKIIGIDVDIAAALADEMGLAVKVVDVGNGGTDAIEKKEVDVVLGIDSTTKETGFWVSPQYLPTGVVLFEPSSSNLATPTAGSDVKVAAQVSSKSAWAVTNVFGEEALVPKEKLTDAFAELKAGNVEYVASDAVNGTYAASREEVAVKIAALLDTPSGYCAMCSQENVPLQEAVSVALSTIVANGTVDVIEKKWLGQVVDLSAVAKIEAAPQAASNVSNESDANKSASSKEDDEDASASASDEEDSSESGSTGTASEKNKPSSSSSGSRSSD